MLERRDPFLIDRAKFATQREVTYILLFIFAGVVIAVFVDHDAQERSTIMQTVVNLTLLAVGYWLGASKAAADTGQAMTRIAEGSAPVAAAAVAAATAAGIPVLNDTVTTKKDETP